MSSCPTLVSNRNDSDRRGRPLCLPCPGCGLSSGFRGHVIARAGQPRGIAPTISTCHIHTGIHDKKGIGKILFLSPIRVVPDRNDSDRSSRGSASVPALSGMRPVRVPRTCHHPDRQGNHGGIAPAVSHLSYSVTERFFPLVEMTGGGF